MRVTKQSFWLPKAGSSQEEYEDAHFPPKDGMFLNYKQRFAIADGASEASYSGEWARKLVAAFVEEHICLDSSAESIAALQQQWPDKTTESKLSWYAEQKAALGAFSTLVGLELQGDESDAASKRIWRAIAAGDSVLVQIREDCVAQSFPISKSASFGRRPNLLASKLPAIASDSDCLHVTAGEWQWGDMFFLMTDAIGCWFLQEAEASGKPWQVLRDLGTEAQPDFATWVDHLRTIRAMQNDDVTLLRVIVDG